MKVTETKVLSLEISELRNFDPIRIVTENYELGSGRITITCEDSVDICLVRHERPFH